MVDTNVIPTPDPDASSAGLVPISVIEKETGFAKEVIRKWESRYGFPRPARDDNGNRLYPVDQIDHLRLIRRLIGAGYRPGKIVGLDLAVLEGLARQLSPLSGAPPSDQARLVLDALSSHDVGRLRALFNQQLARDGLAAFIGQSLASLTTLIGEAWLRGDLRLFEEHLYTEVVLDLLHDAIRTLDAPLGSPRILLATLPGESHILGLLMAEAMMAMEGACCIRLGAQIPVAELAAAVSAYGIDIVGLSFSVAFPAREAAQALTTLRARLDPAVEIWAGGLGAPRLRPLPGVRFLDDLALIAPALHAWTRGGRTLDTP